MKISLNNKIVVITGGTRGIGASMVENFYKAGANIITTGTNINEVEKLNSNRKNKKIKYYQLDLTSKKSTEKFLDEIIKLKKIDILVNNAGVNKIDSISKIKLDDWDKINEVNLRGPFILTRAITKIMKKQKQGRILNISSIFGVNSKAKRAAYSATKWGLVGFTKAAALDLSKYNILVNSLSPGFVNTELTQRILGKDKINEIVKTIPLGRLAQANEIALAALFLCSDLNTYITGQNIVVDGGFTSE